MSDKDGKLGIQGADGIMVPIGIKADKCDNVIFEENITITYHICDCDCDKCDM